MATTCCFFLKDPSDTIDYGMDWNQFLPPTDALTNSEWVVPSGITMTRHRFSARAAYIWLAGGTVDTTYVLTNRITSSEGRIVERSLAILVVER